MTRYGLFCRICNRLLWIGNRRLAPGENLDSSWTHAVDEKPAGLGYRLYWCGCKPFTVVHGELAERPPLCQDLAEPR